MNKLKIITIGKLKNKNLQLEIQELMKRIPKLELIEIKEIKEKNENILKQKEMNLILPYIQGNEISSILMCEYGKQLDTFEFSNQIKKLSSQTNQTLQFIICGAFGPDEKLKQMLPNKISLSKMIFTHEQALYMLIEQIYRYQCIEKNIPYTK